MRALFAMVIFLVGQLHPSSHDSRLFSCFFLFSVNQCFGDLNFPSKLYSKSFLIKLDLPPLLDHKKYLVANFVVGKEPTHFCVCVQHILMDSRCCFYLRASRRISGM